MLFSTILMVFNFKIMYLIGYDVGSSSVKASLIRIDDGSLVKSAFYPRQEMKIHAERPGWAEQDPESWWENLKLTSRDVTRGIDPSAVKAAGISYQMHGLVVIDKDKKVIRPSIIWCDSRAVHYGEEAFSSLGAEYCLSRSLNSPGNFTASKLKWVKENEPEKFEKIWKIMLPGDYIAMRMSGEVSTTITGLSEGILWDFSANQPAGFLMDHYGFSKELLPVIKPVFSVQSRVTAEAAAELGLKEGTPVSYRAGDQPNNAFSLKVLNPGEIAATAGTSGVVYGVSDEVKYDPQSRVNSFAHVNHTENQTRLGVLLCINGTGILYSWLKNNIGTDLDYNELNSLAETVPAGAEGLSILPFGNGAERVLGNLDPGCSVAGLNFNIHSRAHLVRAAQEGIVFSFIYGMEVMRETGIEASVIRAGNANMFLSNIFTGSLSTLSGASIEIYDTDGSMGAARGAGLGAGVFASEAEAFGGLKKMRNIEPGGVSKQALSDAYGKWKENLNTILK